MRFVLASTVLAVSPRNPPAATAINNAFLLVSEIMCLPYLSDIIGMTRKEKGLVY
jgi:hypothetical protein